jgi:hypothetical protein
MLWEIKVKNSNDPEKETTYDIFTNSGVRIITLTDATAAITLVNQHNRDIWSCMNNQQQRSSESMKLATEVMGKRYRETDAFKHD